MSREADLRNYAMLLESDDWQVRRRAADGLREFGREALQILIDALGNDNHHTRRTAVQALAMIRGKQVVPALIEALEDQHDHVRQDAIGGLSRILQRTKDSSLQSRIVEALVGSVADDEEHHVRQRAFRRLSSQGEEILPFLLEDLSPSEEPLRSLVALRVVRQIGCPESRGVFDAEIVSRLLQISWSEFPEHSCEVHMLFSRDGSTLVPIFLELFNYGDRHIRRQAAAWLAVHSDDTMVPTLLTMLQDIDGMVRRSAAFALGRMKEELAVPGLISVLNNDDDAHVLSTCAYALAQIQGNDAVPIITQVLQRGMPHVRRHVIMSLAWTGGDLEAIRAVLQVADSDPDEEVRRWAHVTLGHVIRKHEIDETLDQDILRVLGGALEDTYRVYAQAAGNLAGFARCRRGEGAVYEQTLSIFLTALDDKDTNKRGHTAYLLSNFSDPRIVSRLIE